MRGPLSKGAKNTHKGTQPPKLQLQHHDMASYSSSATMRFFRSGLISTEPGALCALRRLSLRVSASAAARRALLACRVTSHSVILKL